MNITTDSLLSLLKERVTADDVEFRASYENSVSTRFLEKIAVYVGIRQDKEKQESREISFEVDIYMPNQSGIKRAEEIFTVICDAVKEEYSEFSSVTRKEIKTNSLSGGLIVPCEIVFASAVESDVSDDVSSYVEIQGRQISVSKVKIASSNTVKELVSIGEDSPFKTLLSKTKYTIDIEGTGLEDFFELSGFTLVVGEKYQKSFKGCNWSSYSIGDQKGTIISYEKA